MPPAGASRLGGSILYTQKYRGIFIAMDNASLEHEKLVESLNDDAVLADYKKPLDNYRVSLIPRLLGNILVGCGTLVYGSRPSYLKFRAIEVIARVPYQSWASAAFTLLTLFYANEARALKLSTISRFVRFAADSETMHVIVISCFAKKEKRGGFLRFTLIPLFFALLYFWACYLLYLVSPRYSLEMNYLFEHHAFSQYDRFIKENAEALQNKPIESEFLAWYGRNPRSQYEFFRSVRNDELIHRNQSIHQIPLHQ
jgi:ubiquinol oxidase